MPIGGERSPPRAREERGISTLAIVAELRQSLKVQGDEPTIRTAGLAADNELLLAGLRRAAELAGVSIVPAGEPATLGLRSPGCGSPHPLHDVVVHEDRVTVTLAAPPRMETWSVIRSIVVELLDSPTLES